MYVGGHYISEQIMDWPAWLAIQVSQKLEKYIEEGGFDYADNRRFARIDNMAEVSRFWDMESQGCCGSCNLEWDLSHDNGESIQRFTVKVGFNYGH